MLAPLAAPDVFSASCSLAAPLAVEAGPELRAGPDCRAGPGALVEGWGGEPSTDMASASSSSSSSVNIFCRDKQVKGPEHMLEKLHHMVVWLDARRKPWNLGIVYLTNPSGRAALCSWSSRLRQGRVGIRQGERGGRGWGGRKREGNSLATHCWLMLPLLPLHPGRPRKQGCVYDHSTGQVPNAEAIRHTTVVKP